MLYYLLYLLRTTVPVLNVTRYITFRTAARASPRWRSACCSAPG
jgi:hypothetical protein